MDDAVKLFGAHPVLPVHDLPGTVAYYESCLGFTAEPLWGDPPSHATVHQCTVGIQFTQAEPSYRCADYPGWIYIFVTDADQLCARFRTHDVIITREPVSYDYGLREFEIADCNGYRLRFGQYLESD
jgi:predicted enzyme related to lactoylglutathione lyase